eukprot:TRINITY_DN16468_c0_g2_i1.p1 TRINITY_DN16468_c0_g2~~TRINITY_DN16468_c0_g2_i1.p1  ORF type:complete len:360 (+),score=50.33 TRINITY_DN16468_c0_g2_i1:59-1138(+)
MMPAALVAWGILGCGDVTEKKSGPGALNHDGASKLVAVMRRDAAKAADYAQRHQVSKSYSDADVLIADDSITAVYVATPVGSHASLALKVAGAGKPCLLEKPMARNAAESRLIASAFASANMPLFVAYYRRAYPRFVHLRQLLQSQVIGDMQSVTYRHRKPPPAASCPETASHTIPWRHDVQSSGGGLFVDVGSHALDLFDFVFGPLTNISGVAKGPGAPAVETQVDAAFAFEGSSAVGRASWDFEADAFEDTLEIVGAEGTLLLPGLMNGDSTVLKLKSGNEETFFHAPPEFVHRPFVATILDALASGETSRCPSTAESALRTADAIDLILNDYYGGRDGEFWKRHDESAPVKRARVD